MLLENGAKINYKDRFGNTALMVAAAKSKYRKAGKIC